ncbi:MULTISPECIES: DUF2505 domain-containing protein [unclassified Nocardioides]|uniref:DUF2505 domain-containing protein n=1 Tax=unclassified Nocardioides TaxID=2615069 RepID=UPI0007032096|nr:MULTISPECIES: DUF2505 domain-containing protein [unclassified Nocardioides]KQP66541.1 hypothetical protein ASF47_01760 [Nocardioides sp. Leaf285]KQQ41750.1 hypothetical protein ASF50_12565 [Nocardioides sp. Leaf307]
MSKRLKHDLTYDAPLAEVAAMLADRSFREEVCDYQRVLSRTVTVTPKGDRPEDGMEVVIDQVQPAKGIPSFATKFVGDEINIVQTESWSTIDRGAVLVTIPGKPGEMKGTATLREAGGVTTETVDLEIKVGIPLVGGKIEGLVSDMLLKALKAENKVGREYLAR